MGFGLRQLVGKQYLATTCTTGVSKRCCLSNGQPQQRHTCLQRPARLGPNQHAARAASSLEAVPQQNCEDQTLLADPKDIQLPKGAEPVPVQRPQQGSLSAEPQITARTIELSVSGLQGPECTAKIQAAFDKMSGVKVVEADLEARRLTVSAASDITVRQLMESVRQMSSGYRAVPYREQTWRWRGYRVNYAEVGQGRPVVLVHGFGGNVHHYRKLAADLSESHRVLALDLLGFGASEKPPGEVYDPHLWQRQVADFIAEFCPNEQCVLVGNSIGSQVALYVAAEQPERVAGVCLLNCAGGMNQKGLYQDDWVIRVMRPMFAAIEMLLKRRSLAAWLFEKFRSPERIKQLLVMSSSNGLPPPYANPEAVHDELIDILCDPANDAGAVDVFVGVFTGDPGPRPEALVERIACPLLVCWGEADPWTPLTGSVGRFFTQLAAERDSVKVVTLPDTGHCPQDDRPELVAEALLPWLREVYAQ